MATLRNAASSMAVFPAKLTIPMTRSRPLDDRDLNVGRAVGVGRALGHVNAFARLDLHAREPARAVEALDRAETSRTRWT